MMASLILRALGDEAKAIDCPCIELFSFPHVLGASLLLLPMMDK
jgi:hypothetical protein